MIKEFREDKEYVFTTKKYKEDCRRDGEKRSEITNDYTWSNQCNGRKVNIQNKNIGEIYPYSIYPEWCKEVPKTNKEVSK